MTTRFLHFLSTPVILALSIPLTTFAVFTTLLALATLLFRVSIVYCELAFAIVQSAIYPLSDPMDPTGKPPESITNGANSSRPRLRRHRRTSSSASASSLSALQTPGTNGMGISGLGSRQHSLASLVGGAGGQATPRDYESVGGWRLTSDNAEDEALWTGINSRLELPALTLPSPSAGRYAAAAANRRGSAYAKGQGSPTEAQRRRRWRGGAESPEGYFSSSFGGSGVAESPALVMTTSRGLGRNGDGSAEGSRRASRRSSISMVRVREESTQQ